MPGDPRAFAQTILDDIDVGIITTDPWGSVTVVNRTARELLGLDRDPTGTDIRVVLHLHEPLAALPRRTLGHHLTTDAGVELDLELSIRRHDEGPDARIGFVIMFRDVGEELRREAELRRLERLAAMGTMVAGFAHEVRNPVAALRSICEELGEVLTERDLELPHLGHMLQVLERIERLVRASLLFGRPAAPRRGRHQPSAIVTTALSEVEPRVRTGDGRIRLELEDDLPAIHVDEVQLSQVIVILLNNALDAAAPDHVLVRVSRTVFDAEATRSARKSQPPPRGAVRFEVIDDGPGIPPAVIGRVFDPFFTTKSTGTGLGLSIAQQLASENGVRIEVESSRGGPTTFAVIAPEPEG